MWRLYLADRSYRTALEFCRSTSQRDKVLTEQADHCFEGGHYEQAAEIYAQTNKSFEEVTLKFTIKAQIAALKAQLVGPAPRRPCPGAWVVGGLAPARAGKGRVRRRMRDATAAHARKSDCQMLGSGLPTHACVM